ncbi:MAG: HigA family addiction module antidote protein [Eubacteriaceae bacterium]|nr:HigA family addiction module antidote protein [Eubacteriaceae bacterium]
MMDYISTPKMSEILKEEFMVPMNLSAYRLAKEIHVPVSRIQAILVDKRKITADTSLRLAKYFGVSDKYFLDMQTDLDIRETKAEIEKELSDINPIEYVAMKIKEPPSLRSECFETEE